jgi:hypothetical protein
MGNLMKVGLVLDGDPFGRGDTFYLASELHGEDGILYLVRPHGRDLAMAFIGGGLARGLAAAELEEAVTAPLVAMAGRQVRARIGACLASDWHRDPLALGSYSVARPGKAAARGPARPVERAAALRWRSGGRGRLACHRRRRLSQRPAGCRRRAGPARRRQTVQPGRVMSAAGGEGN